MQVKQISRPRLLLPSSHDRRSAVDLRVLLALVDEFGRCPERCRPQTWVVLVVIRPTLCEDIRSLLVALEPITSTRTLHTVFTAKRWTFAIFVPSSQQLVVSKVQSVIDRRPARGRGTSKVKSESLLHTLGVRNLSCACLETEESCARASQAVLTLCRVAQSGGEIGTGDRMQCSESLAPEGHS